MKQTIYIVDDDRSVLKILSNIIKEHELGKIIGKAECGQDAIDDIKALRPNIILLDFLLPDFDGLDVIKSMPADYQPTIVMISEVRSKEMIAKAYRLGIEFFINKPINVVEVVSVVKKVKEHLRLRQVIGRFEDAFSHLHQSTDNTHQSNEKDIHNRAKRLLGKMGVLGESGCDDLISAVLWIKQTQQDSYRLSDLYSAIVEDPDDKSQIYAVEQRIRRTITKAFNELSERGLEDYSDYTFEQYASLLFDFSEIRKQMSYLKGDSKTSGKVSIRKFIEGVLVEIS